jgi:uncharacterized membrane protein
MLDSLLILYSLFYLGLFITDYSFIPLILHRPSGHVSNIIWPTVLFIFLLFLRWAIDKKSFPGLWLIKQIKRIGELDDKILLLFGIIAIFIIFTALGIARHLSLSSGTWDLGLFDQAIWNTAQGDILFSSIKNNINLLGDHFEPILLFIAPLYRFWPSVYVLVILQSLLLASAIIPLYLIAKYRLKERLVIFAFIISYVLSRPLRGIGLFDFHPECFILPLLFWAYYFLITRRNTFLFLSLFLLLLCKEDTAFLIVGLGIFAFLFLKRRGLGAGLFMSGIAAWVILTKIIIPHFNPLHQYDYMNRLPFGLTYQDNIKAVLNSPSLLGRLILDKAKIEYCIKLFAPLGFLPLLSPSHYILIAIPLLRNLMPSPEFSGWYKISSHYTASLIPFIYIAGIYGAGSLLERIRHRKTSLLMGLFIIFTSLMFYGKTDAHKFTRFLYTINNSQTLRRLSYLKMIPAYASVSTNFNLVPHLSHRKYIFEWNPQSKTSYITEYIVLDLTLAPAKMVAVLDSYFSDIAERGYRQVFSSADKAFLIFHNPGIDKSLVEKLR